MSKFTIVLDPRFDLREAGCDDSDGACDAFADAYIAEASRLATERGIAIEVEIDDYTDRQRDGHVSSDEENELWQEIHDRVVWPPIDR